MTTRRRRFRSKPKPQIKRPPANQELLRFPEVRLVGVDGAQLGVMATTEALRQATELQADLVLVAEKTTPPVARILDVGKYMYERKKKESKQKAQSKGGEVKGVRIGFKIGEHDWHMRLNQAAEFLQGGNKVKLEMRLRGREKGRLDLAEKKIFEFIAQVPSGAKQEGPIGKSPRGLTILLTR
jgi:translation initiation factor IF-3